MNLHILPTGLYPEKQISESTVSSLGYATAENTPLCGLEITLLIRKASLALWCLWLSLNSALLRVRETSPRRCHGKKSKRFQ